MERQDRLEHGVRLVLVAGDVGVLVQAEDFGLRDQRERLDKLDKLLHVLSLGAGVRRAGAEGEVVGENFGDDVVVQQVVHQPPVLVVRDPSSVVDLSAQDADHLVGDLLVVVNHHLDLALAHVEVAVGEVVPDVPTQRAKLAPVLDHGVEEADGEQQPLVARRVLALVHVLIRDSGVRSDQVGFQTLRGLERHLDAVLQDRDRERGRRHGGEPEPEVRVHGLGVDRLADDVELGHPRLRQVAVLQTHPHALLHGPLDHRLRLGPLALAQRHLVEPLQHLLLLAQFEEVRHRIRTRGQHEDERRVHPGLCVARLQVEGRRLDEPAAQLGGHKVGDAEHEPIGSDAPDHQQLLELVQLSVEGVVQRETVRLAALKVFSVVVHARGEGVGESGKGGQVGRVDHLDPDLLGDPLGGGVLRGDVGVGGTGE